MNPSNRIETETKTRPLKGKRVAILATDGFEQAELTEPREALERAGATTRLIAPKHGKIKGWKSKNWGDEVAVDVVIGEARADDYDALLLPGGVMNPDRLRTDKGAVNFVRSFFSTQRSRWRRYATGRSC